MVYFLESQRRAGTQENEWSSHKLVNIVKNLDSDFTAEKTCDSIIEWKDVWRVQFVAQNMRGAEIHCSQSDISYYKFVFAEYVKKILFGLYRWNFTWRTAMTARIKKLSYNVGNSLRKSNLNCEKKILFRFYRSKHTARTAMAARMKKKTYI